MLGCLLLANCSSSPNKLGTRVDPKYGVSASPRVIEPGQPVPKGGGAYRVGKPYVVAGRTYVPREDKHYRSEGVGSWYGDDFHGRLTANGEIYDMDAISAAHPILPMPCYARVTNLRNGRSLVVRVNDRGPYHADREIDLSRKAAELLAYQGRGLARVRVEYVGPAPLEGSDDRRLMATLRDGGPAEDASPVRVGSVRSGPSFEASGRRATELAQQALGRTPVERVRFDERRQPDPIAARLASADPAAARAPSDDPRHGAARTTTGRAGAGALAMEAEPAAKPAAPRSGILGTMPVGTGRGLY